MAYGQSCKNLFRWLLSNVVPESLRLGWFAFLNISFYYFHSSVWVFSIWLIQFSREARPPAKLVVGLYIPLLPKSVDLIMLNIDCFFKISFGGGGCFRNYDIDVFGLLALAWGACFPKKKVEFLVVSCVSANYSLAREPAVIWLTEGFSMVYPAPWKISLGVPI